MSEVLCLDHYGTKVLGGLRSLLTDKSLCDLTLAAEGNSVRVHKVVMAATSDYFRALLTLDMREKAQDVISLKGVPFRGLQEVIHFAYRGQLHCTFDNITDVLLAATHLQFVDAVGLCSRYLTGLTSVGNCLDMYGIAEQFSLTALRDKSLGLILSSFEEISRRDDFLNFDAKFLLTILRDNRLQVSGELRLFQLVMRWIAHDAPQRARSTEALLSCVRLPLIRPSDLVSKVMREESLKRDPACLELLLEANTYHMLVERQPLLQTARTQVRSNTSSIIILDVDGDGPHVFHLASRTWGSLRMARVETFHAQVAVIDNFMYICGGIELYSTNNPVSSKCYRYDPRFDTWAEMSPMEEPRHHFTLAGTGGSLYAVGGYSGGHYKDVVEEYSLADARWARRASLDVRLSASASAVHRQTVYVAGGQADKGISRGLWAYDTQRDAWTSRAPMLAPRMDHTVCVHSNQLYVVGGYNKDVIKAYDMATVDVYDIELDQWSVFSDNTPKISGINSCLIDHTVYTVGGFSYDDNKKRSEIRSFNLRTKEWAVVGRIHSPAMAVPCCALYIPRDILREIAS